MSDIGWTGPPDLSSPTIQDMRDAFAGVGPSFRETPVRWGTICEKLTVRLADLGIAFNREMAKTVLMEAVAHGFIEVSRKTPTSTRMYFWMK
jgi:hypothetical protein